MYSVIHHTLLFIYTCIFFRTLVFVHFVCSNMVQVGMHIYLNNFIDTKMLSMIPFRMNIQEFFRPFIDKEHSTDHGYDFDQFRGQSAIQ